MEQKIDLEIRLRELAAQSMLEARNEIDVLEVEKSLLTSDQRMNCYASQLEQQRKQMSNPSLSTDSGRGSKSGNRRSDVIGSPVGLGTTGSGGGGTGGGAVDVNTSSPSFSSLSNSQSPSKLSPVSGQSANSPSFNSTISRHHSRTGGHRYSSGCNNTLSAKQRAKNKRREQLMQSITSLSNINCNMVVNNRASVSISEIRIPLMWRDVDHFKGRGDYKRYAIFCLLKMDSQIYDTQLISDVDRDITDVTFDDVVVFNEIDHNFELSLEVYSCVYLEQYSLSSTPRKLKEKLTSSVSRAMGRRLATQTASINYTKELQAYDKSYRFAMIASAILRLDDASNSVKTYDLVLVTPSVHHRHHQHQAYASAAAGHNNMSTLHNGYSISTSSPFANTNPAIGKDIEKNTLPLFGHFCCKLLVAPNVFDKNIKIGYLRLAPVSVPNSNNNIHSSNNNASDSDRGSDNSPNISLTTNNGFDSASDSAKALRSALAASSKLANLSLSASSSVHWALLRNFCLYLWPVDEPQLEAAFARGCEPQHAENLRNTPKLSLNIDKYTRLLRVSNSSLTLETDKGCFVLAAYGGPTNIGGSINQSEEMSQWLRAIEQLIYDSHIWGSVLNHDHPPHRVGRGMPPVGSSSTSTTTTPDTSKAATTTRRISNRSAGVGVSKQQQHYHNSQQKPPGRQRFQDVGAGVLQADL